MTFNNNSNVLAQNYEVEPSTDTVSNRIKKLPPLLVNQLAAGEVVTRPASVVKELIENAIDAGAQHIDIRITQGGMGIIEVADDGCGIHPDDMVMAVTRFATSKIADVAHLQGIATLGFRGEALAATAAVSRLTLTSCSDDSGIGRQLNVAGILEDTPQMLPVVRARGTTVTVKDLYFNVPARRGNLKSISTEYAHIEMVVKHLALVASDVSFSLWHNDKRRFNFESINSVVKGQANIAVLGSEAMKSNVMQSVLLRLMALIPTTHDQTQLFDESNLQPLNISLEGLHYQTQESWQKSTQEPLSINGFLIPSSKALLNANYKLIYINGRLVKDRRIAQSIRESTSSLPEDYSLGYVLFFNLPKGWLNLNVHPSKQNIKIQNLANIVAHLEVGVRDALQQWQLRNQHRINKSSNAMFSKKTSATSNSIAYNEQQYKGQLSSTKSQSIHCAEVQQPREEYELKQDRPNNDNTQSKDSVCLASESLDKFEFLNFRDNHQVSRKIQETPLAALSLRVVEVLDNSAIIISMLDKLKVHSHVPDAIRWLALIESHQDFYLFSEAGLKEGLQSCGISSEVGSAVTVEQEVSLFTQTPTPSQLDRGLQGLMRLPNEGYQQLFAHAVAKISFSDLIKLMIENL